MAVDGMRPNIVYFNTHDTGRYVGPYGHKIRTPHLQNLAERGVIFRQAFSAAPTCSPSRAALCTGEYPHVTGMVGLGGNRGVHPFQFDHHIAYWLRAAGYETVTWGNGDKWLEDNHMGTGNANLNTKALGYERVLEEKSIQAVAQYIAEPHEKPFFLSASHMRTHRIGHGFTAAPSRDDDPRFVALPAPLADTPAIRKDWAHFMTDAHELDLELGQVISALERAGQSESTLLIVTTDHGPAFPGMKCNLTVHGTGVMLLIGGPGGFGGGKAVDGLVSQIDIFPTLCEAAGIPPPPWLQGRPLQALTNGDATQIHDEIFAEVSYHISYEPMRAVRTSRYAYIRRFGERRLPVLPNTDGCPSKNEWMALGFGRREHPVEALFDTFYDPQEMSNICHEVSYSGVLDEMRGRLQNWMQRTEDPLLHGRVPLPLTGWETMADDPGGKRLVYEPGSDPRVPWTKRGMQP